MAIGSFRHGWLRDFYVNDVRTRRIPHQIEDVLFQKLQMLDAAASDQDLRSPPSNHFEKLSGKLSEFHSVRINRHWRLIFKWNRGTGEATEIDLDDHSYKAR
jgi:proteic killer suppression protein